MAVLAADPGGSCWAIAILIPDDLQLDAEVDGNLVATDAELRLRDLVVCDHTLMDIVAAAIRGGFDGIRILVGQDLLDHALFAAAVNRLVDLTWFYPSLAVDLAVLFFDSVARDSAHAFTRYLTARPQRRLTRFAELCPDLLVASHTKCANRALRERLELLLEFMEHR